MYLAAFGVWPGVCFAAAMPGTGIAAHCSLLPLLICWQSGLPEHSPAYSTSKEARLVQINSKSWLI